MGLRARALAAGYALAAPGDGESVRPGALTATRLGAWAAGLARLHRLEVPDDLPDLAPPEWLGRLRWPLPVDIGPLVGQAMMRQPQMPAGEPPARRFCHRGWRLRNARFDGERLAGIDGWEAAGAGDPAGDLAGVLVGLVADGASAGAAEALAQAFATAYTTAGGVAILPATLAAWTFALAGERLVASLEARERMPHATASDVADVRLSGQARLWAGLLGRTPSAWR